MQFRHIILMTLAFWFVTDAVTGQGIHFTQYNLSPLTLNPALTGKYEGTFRVGGIVRDQWKAVISENQYQTGSVYIDAPIIRGFRRKDWVGIGVMAFRDQVSAGKLTTTSFKISGAYHLALDKKGSNILTLGIQNGNESKKLNNNYLYEDEILNPGTQIPDAAFLADTASGKFNDWTAGLLFSSQMNKNTEVQVGVTFQNLLKQEFSAIATGSSSFRQPRRFMLHGKFDTKLNKLWTLSPSFLYNTTAAQDEIMLQALAGYLFNEKMDLTFHMGLSYRLRDAISPMFGAQYKKLRIGAAYDFRTGPVVNTISNGRGGIEIAAYYIQKIYKAPKVKTKLLCPRF